MLERTLKIADIDTDKLFGGSGRRPKNPQGTRPLTHYWALPDPVLAGRQEKGVVAPFLLDQRSEKRSFAEDLSLGTIVLIELWFGSIASEAGAVIRDVTI